MYALTSKGRGEPAILNSSTDDLGWYKMLSKQGVLFILKEVPRRHAALMSRIAGAWKYAQSYNVEVSTSLRDVCSHHCTILPETDSGPNFGLRISKMMVIIDCVIWMGICFLGDKKSQGVKVTTLCSDSLASIAMNYYKRIQSYFNLVQETFFRYFHVKTLCFQCHLKQY